MKNDDNLCVQCNRQEAISGFNCCFDCLWIYSRTHRRHSIPEMEYEIYVCAEFGFTHHKKDGYDLHHKGKKIAHGKTVKELKEIVRKQVVPTNKQENK